MPSFSHAQNNTGTTPPLKTLRAAASEAAMMRQSTISTTGKNRKARALAEIDRRIMLLSEASKKVDSLTHITATEKSTLTTRIQTAITNLQTLKTTISNNNDDATLATNIQSLLNTHKDFSMILPEARILIAAELMDAIANKMLEVVKKIEVRTAVIKAAGEKTASIDPLILNLKAELANIKAQSNSITAAVTPLSAGDTTNKAVLATSQAKLKKSMQDLKTAASDLREILKLLKAVSTETTATGSAAAQ